MQIFSADKQPDDLNCVTDQLGNVWSYNPSIYKWESSKGTIPWGILLTMYGPVFTSLQVGDMILSIDELDDLPDGTIIAVPNSKSAFIKKGTEWFMTNHVQPISKTFFSFWGSTSPVILRLGVDSHAANS